VTNARSSARRRRAVSTTGVRGTGVLATLEATAVGPARVRRARVESPSLRTRVEDEGRAVGAGRQQQQRRDEGAEHRPHSRWWTSCRPYTGVAIPASRALSCSARNCE
jgi:hypothetical protein